ncbi:MAG: 3-dehydroquinate synthase [Candidatus Omnitrophica bacterium]|nr:3-dehydroquinate synthase [Candidatus Omnitrophota bacterium]MDD5441225.1 3-dehydroquinate synthase [Candidatus Omnitrophota bacterium]
MTKNIKVKIKENSYEVVIGANNFLKSRKLFESLKTGNYPVVITSSKVYQLYKLQFLKIFGDKNTAGIIVVPNGESAKSKEVFLRTLNRIMGFDKVSRTIYIVAVGGGTVGDLAGFAASVYKRGIPVIQVPTTLLAQVDSSIGGKTAIDFNGVKNIVGTFYQPKRVITDIEFLRTLTDDDFNQGIAEAIKYGIIMDKDFFNFLKVNKLKILSREPKALTNLVAVSAKCKAMVVSRDETEKSGLRTILNFGHTFAHALEGITSFKKITHGEAVAIGMAYAAYLSYIMGKTSENEVKAVITLIQAYNLPVTAKYEPKQLFKKLVYDKKFSGGTVRMVLLSKIGRVEVVSDISLDLVRQTLKKFQGYIDKYV